MLKGYYHANNLDAMYGDGNDDTNSVYNGGGILRSNTLIFASAGQSMGPRSAERVHRLSHSFSAIHSMTDLQWGVGLVCICPAFPIYNLPSSGTL